MTRNALSAAVLLLAFAATACTHDLQVKNIDQYQVPFRSAQDVTPLRVAVRPFAGGADSLFYYNAVLERLNQTKLVGDLQTEYTGRSAPGAEPDVILSVRTAVDYRSSVWNFFVNWPGFLIFTPAWNGYLYRADILTSVDIEDTKGKFDEAQIPISYNLRHAEFDRTVFTGVTWLEVSALAFFGGIYNATSFDRDVIAPLQYRVKDNYSQYVLTMLEPKLEAASRVLRPAGATSNAAPTAGQRNAAPVPAAPRN